MTDLLIYTICGIVLSILSVFIVFKIIVSGRQSADINTHNYWIAVRNKLTENFTSVKVWFFLWPFLISTIYLSYIVYEHLFLINSILAKEVAPDTLTFVIQSMTILGNTFIGWCTFNVSLAGTIVVVREQFKVEKIKALNCGPEDTNKDISKVSS